MGAFCCGASAAGAWPLPERFFRRAERCCWRPGGGQAPMALTSRCSTASLGMTNEA